MKKLLLILSFFLLSFSSLNADYLFVKNNRCIKSYFYSNWNLNFYYSATPTVLYVDPVKSPIIKSGYVYDPILNTCSKFVILQKLGLQYSDYKMLMALLGLLLGSSFLFALLRIFSRK